MPVKRSKSKIPFKIFSSDNYSKLASRFPFLKERQIKAKLLQAWRNQFDTKRSKTAKHERDKLKLIPKNKHQNETLLSEDSNDRTAKPEVNKVEYSPLRTYSAACHSQKRKAQEHQATKTRNEPHPRQSSVCESASSLDANEGSKQRSPKKQRSRENELIDLFEEIRAEQLLIDPSEMHQEDRELRPSEQGSFNHKKWLEKLSQNVQKEKNTGTVSGMFKWRADRKRKSPQNYKEEQSSESRFLESNECEGSSNFLSMFDGKEDIFF